MKKVNIGCGTNKIEGWENYDVNTATGAEILDIRNPLPFGDNTVDFYFAEHVVEHVNYKQAWDFFDEAYRTMKSGSVMRIIVPCIIKQYESRNSPDFKDYIEYYNKRGWSDKTLKGVSKSVLFNHEHEMAWSKDLMVGMLNVIGFEAYESELYISKYPELSNLEGHWRVVGKKINDLEALCVEAIKK